MDYYDLGSTYGSNNYGGLAGLSAFSGILGLASAAFAIVVMWKIFQKAGKEGWRAIVPFYNLYTLFEITWGNGWLFLLMFLAIIPILGSIAVLVILIMTYVKLAKSFGKSGGFAVGLIFLSVIFMAILAFDSSTYLGVPGKETVPTGNSNPNPEPATPVTPAAPAAPVTPVGPEPTTNETAPSFCRNCGTQMKAEEAFCPNCGTPKAN